ncbi:LysR substrate-binding domain-containing protein [Burkholderia cepacia]|uniref:LysR substrate-binding domain-containing protein n=1 Tax=Burkholderia cepacia TaxID=292 RepID=UPI0007571008|nr:LysR substrate-binding domain-containing protein [Burkholderia cepacia]KVS58193.1 LysR family transcriptional regulator [Burkholderia cepacia]RQT70865.1 LysR family transcriptional regulator [Burkholderia cepacia]RQT91646.1 LysR family transcriptional regulator [Burkholderia cepacia]RQZ67404.1 LysR family transcriptional regulator [Burkholderia cepacia]RQZ89683.1 LysR family transcriptional regulator [Burkholderia cepacia]
MTSNGVLSDLNDLRYFAMVVEHGGFSAAERALGIPKSRLSARVAVLEKKLGVRLLQRTTRHVSLTEIGKQFFTHCQGLLAEAQAAQDVVDMASSAPRGLVRISCPILATRVYVAPYLPQFMARYPNVSVHMLSVDRAVDLRTEPIDIALRIRHPDDMDPDAVTKSLGVSRRILVASPRYLADIGPITRPEALSELRTLFYDVSDTPSNWTLLHATSNERAVVKHRPVLASSDCETVVEAAAQGLGVAMLPDVACATALARRRLRVVLPEWSAPELVVHLAFLTRRGMLPSVRALVDFLAEQVPMVAT